MKIIKRIAALFVALSLLCTAAVIPAFAGMTPTFTVAADKNAVSVGDTVTFTVSLDHSSGESVLLAEMYLNYDAANLEFVQASAVDSAEANAEISEVSPVTDEGSSAVYYEYLANEDGFVISGGVQFFSAQFSVVGTDNWEVPTLEITSLTLIDMETELSCEIIQSDCGIRHVCVFNKDVTVPEALKSAADCDDAAVYYKSCTCGAISTTETFTYGTANGHTESDWQSSETDHWKFCAVCTEEIVSSRGTHADTDSNNACDTCGYDMTPDHVCEFNQENPVAGALKSEADCENAAVYYKSCTCGAISTTETFTYGSASGHNESDWQKSEADHWKYCTVCTEEIADSRGTHADTDGDNACDACGYDMTPAQPDEPEHTCVFDQEVVKTEALKSKADCENAAVYYKSCACGAISTTETFTHGDPNGHTPSAWQIDSAEHWKVCTVCTEEIADSHAAHADNDHNKKCDVCGHNYSINSQPVHTTVLPGVSISEMPFTDVSKSDWFYDEVRSAWKYDLIDGLTPTLYKPHDALTVAQTIKLAAALHQMDTAGCMTLSNGSRNWYDTYVTYAVNNGIIESKYAFYTPAQMNAAVERAEFVHIFFGSMSASSYTARNHVADNAIPDVKLRDAYAEEIYTFYRAGILTGNNAAGVFAPNSSIKRSEAAAILSRMYDVSAREDISLG